MTSDLERNEINGHYYVDMQQGPAICLYCNKCSSAGCCSQDECDRNVLESLARLRRNLEREFFGKRQVV